MPLPDYIDNDRHKLKDVLETIIQSEKQTVLDIATGFFRIEAWIRLEQALNQLTSLRLLIGRDPTIMAAERDRVDLTRYFRRNVQGQLEGEPFNLDYKQNIDRLIAYLEQAHIQVRLYGAMAEGTPFLHAKAYIFDDYCIVGSSNFTPSGLQGNTELNMLNKHRYAAQNLRNEWFEKFWNDPSVDTDYKTKLIATLNASKFGSKSYTPYQVFVKALYELFKEDVGLEKSNDRTSLELASFQQEGFERAVRLLERHNACMIADAVGLGKTFIGLRLLDHYLIKDKRPGYVPRALVICPAQLRDLVWRKKLDDFGIKATVISQEELGRKNFNTKQFSRYDIVVVDESHNFRNSGTNRYQNLQRLLQSGKRNKRVVLLTATPINNTVFDLRNQILLLTRNRETYYQEWGISNLQSYFQDLNQGKTEITELLMQTMVRRSRQDVIKRQQAGEQIFIAGKEIRFPRRQLEQFTYNFESSFQGLYAGIAQQIDQLNLAPYNIKAFKKKPNKDDQTQIKRNEALVALMKALYLKRLESSLLAFENSITSQRVFQSEFDACLDAGLLLDGKTFRKIIAAETEEEEYISIGDLIASLEEVDPKEYDTNQLKAQINEDFHALEDILRKLEAIRNKAQTGQDYDLKLAAFKQLLLTLKGQKVLVFSYFKDTAVYVYQELLKDEDWLRKMRSTRAPQIDLITGATPGKQREEKVRHFAPIANCQTAEDLELCESQPIDILICTDVLSEGQNLQDAGVLINYDLHWNPVRMIQRAGRIDRLGTNFDQLSIYNCFPEEGLEDLLGLVARLQQRIATIDREVGLDASVLGETISERSLEEIRRLKEADTDAEKAAILEELEQASDLVSLDEMRFPLQEFMLQMGTEAAEEIPLGIHSTRSNLKDVDGVFLAFRVRNRHLWHFYPRINGHISTGPDKMITGYSTIFKWLKCNASDYPNPDELPPVPFDNAIFAILEGATRNLLQGFKKQQSSTRLRPTLSKLLQKIQTALTQADLFIDEPTDAELKERVLRVIVSANLRSYEKDIKAIWSRFAENRNLTDLISDLDILFVDQELYYEVEEEEEINLLDIIREEEVQLVCYQWFKPQ
ncbi:MULTISPECIES: helicase-related protein [Leptolyngbya]|uniref:helicase-related protein n=1 Tax=Leptolyngbya TaxID=47251 RepID=UPI0016867AE4|nr:helicase-related protein [Leptolyngbya sp. FACHB-1624]MBD1858592.1 helicase [Leptolyngbya sp. FACHB-1624]